ncbi:hypothetical protein RHMOL_Rhmol04G0043300 [Rhododendron molle]|uniref:Uncharacterized protein n=1 Tax=Rhododendron molle TaxID=49168 RepID=A0ACC0NX05_RHOML|nr:hypothetical protein RHMOL_Rhmol04G0043300 [Rhododendron molle]
MVDFRSQEIRRSDRYQSDDDYRSSPEHESMGNSGNQRLTQDLECEIMEISTSEPQSQSLVDLIPKDGGGRWSTQSFDEYLHKRGDQSEEVSQQTQSRDQCDLQSLGAEKDRFKTQSNLMAPLIKQLRLVMSLKGHIRQ